MSKFNSITVCENQEDFDQIKEDIVFPCVVVIGSNTYEVRCLGLEMVFGKQPEPVE